MFAVGSILHYVNDKYPNYSSSKIFIVVAITDYRDHCHKHNIVIVDHLWRNNPKVYSLFDLVHKQFEYLFVDSASAQPNARYSYLKEL